MTNVFVKTFQPEDGIKIDYLARFKLTKDEFLKQRCDKITFLEDNNKCDLKSCKHNKEAICQLKFENFYIEEYTPNCFRRVCKLYLKR